MRKRRVGEDAILDDETVSFVLAYYTKECNIDTDSTLRIKDALLKAPYEERVSYILYIDGYTCDRIADYLKITSMRVSRAKKNMRMKLEALKSELHYDY